MAFADFSSDLKQRELPRGLLDMHANDVAGESQADGHAISYRVRLALIVVASLMLWGAIFETARLIFS